MPDISEIVEQFDSLGVQISSETATTCLDLCLKYSLSEEALVNSWIAFSFSSLNGAEPTKENLEILERKELSIIKTPKRSNTLQTASSVQVYSSGGPKGIIHTGGTFTPPRSGRVTEKLAFSPLVFTPEVYTPSEKFNSRKNSGQCISTFGKSSNDWKSAHNDVNISMYTKTDPDQWRYLFESLLWTADSIEGRLENLSSEIIQKYKLPQLVPFADCTISPMIFRGRVHLCSKNQTTQQHKIEIQGMEESNFQIIELDVTHVEGYALFPGQVIVFEGLMDGKRAQARKMYTSAVLPLPPTPTLVKPLNALIAAGPFALSDTLSYEPLNDLIELVKKEQPNVLILIGPLVDATHPLIAKQQIAETFNEFYTRLIQRIGDSLESLETKVAVIASSKDANNLHVYPTPPAMEHHYKGVTFYPDPSVLSIDGLVIGITSVDTIFHLGKYEVSNCQTNRLGRLAAHTIHQRSFYPLNPSERDVCIDQMVWAKEGLLTVTPHIMILPSDLHGFIKEAEGCILINPGKLTKGLAGGSYGLIEVRPIMKSEEWKTSTHISSKIVRI